MRTKKYEKLEHLFPVDSVGGEAPVDARLLHEFLENKSQFADWIKDKIKKYGFIEGQDFVTFQEIVKRKNGTRGADVKTEYKLTISCAKEIGMVEGNAKGRQVRQHFIACEKALKHVVQNELTAYRESARKRLLKSSELKEIDIQIKELIKKRNVLRRELNAIDRSDFRQLTLGGFDAKSLEESKQIKYKPGKEPTV